MSMTDGRTGPRTNMFITAVMTFGGGSAPVRVRDMSARGALIDTPVAPSVGEVIQLSRGSLAASGTIVWSVGSRCGVRFSFVVAVREWMTPPHNAGQARVDALTAQVRSGSPHPPAFAVLASPGTPEVDKRLAQIESLLEQLAEALAEDVTVLLHHSFSVQNLDLALQLLAGVRADPLINGRAPSEFN